MDTPERPDHRPPHDGPEAVGRRAPGDATNVEARALADPTRLRILRHLVDADHPLGIEELTRFADVHHNAVRSHLHRLVEAGLAVEGLQRRVGRGRPRLQYTAGPLAVQRLRGVAGHEELTRSLVHAMEHGRTPREQGVLEGAAIAAALSSPAGGDPVAVVERWARDRGFAPQVVQDRVADDQRVDGTVEDARVTPAAVTVRLHACPYAELAAESPRVVCALHLGLAEGLAQAAGGRVEALEIADPRRGGCTLRLSR